MKFSKCGKYILIGLLILLNIILRIPSYPHQTGYDSFHTAILANIISLSGHAGWWLNPLSIFGMYPYSYASAVPFMLSGISQLSGLEMEITVLIFDVFTGLLSIFTAYLLAGMIRDDDLFKFLVAFGCSTAQGMLVFTTWDISTRGLFIVLLPLFTYLVLRIRINKLRAYMLAMMLFVLLAAIHHYIYFTFPVIASFIMIVVATKINDLKLFQRDSAERSIKHTDFLADSSITGDYVSSKLKTPIVYPIKRNFLKISYLVLFFTAFLSPFFTRTFITAGSRYGWVLDMFIINTRYTGPLILLFFGGFTYLVLKDDKRPEDWFLLVILLFLIPFSYVQTYAHFILFTFLFLFIGVSLTNILHAYSQKRKCVKFVIIASLLIAVSFSGFYQHWHTGMNTGRDDWRMTDETYVGGKWMGGNINTCKTTVGNGGVVNTRYARMAATSGGMPSILTGMPAVDLSYGFINESYIVMKENSPLTKEFYLDNPYVEVRGRSIGGSLNWFSDSSDIDSGSGKNTIDRFNISHIIENTDIHDLIIRSVQEKKNNIYDSGKIRIWDLGK
jgi:hypothetical protein